MPDNEYIYEYIIDLMVKNYIPDSGMVLKTSYALPGYYMSPVTPEEIVSMFESGVDVEFQMLSKKKDGKKSEFEPILMRVRGVSVEILPDEYLEAVAKCEIILVDSLPYLPMGQTGDVYDNLLDAGFEVTYSLTILDNENKNIYDRLLEGNFE
jgi:hypothetical protein